MTQPSEDEIEDDIEGGDIEINENDDDDDKEVEEVDATDDDIDVKPN